MNWLAIVNASSGGGRSRKQLRPVLDRIHKLSSQVVFTRHKGHARDLANHAGAFDGVVVVGGDGTLLEVLNGIDLLKQRLAIVATGRGNSLARDLSLFSPDAGCAAIESGNCRRIDLMQAVFDDSSGRRTLLLAASTVAVGYPAAVVRAAHAIRKLGGRSYAAATLGVRPVFQSLRISVDDDDAAETQLTGFLANNTRHLGSFLALPEACCHDGHFDVMPLRAGFIPQILHNASVLSRLRFYDPVKLMPMARVTLSWDRPQELMVDGELFPDVVSVQISVREAAAQCIRGDCT